jgi:NAD(P)H-hydrate epimerase
MYLSRDQVRELDLRAIEEFGVPGIVLMENAGRGVAELMLRLGCRGPVVICCGKGNNGGDGFVIARHLDLAGVLVRLLLFARPEDLTGDAATAYTIASRSGLPLTVHAEKTLDVEAVRREISAAEWVVDALFGTGLSGPLRAPFDQVVGVMDASPARVLAVDIPSGLDCDTGRPLGPAVRAHDTATFVALKEGFADPAARPWLGAVHIIGIGAPRQLVESYQQNV